MSCPLGVLGFLLGLHRLVLATGCCMCPRLFAIGLPLCIWDSRDRLTFLEDDRGPWRGADPEYRAYAALALPRYPLSWAASWGLHLVLRPRILSFEQRTWR